VTATRPDGAVGGPRAAALAREIREALRDRGDHAEADGALAATAAWMAGQSADARRHGMREFAVREGFPGMVSTAAVYQLDGGDGDAWRQSLASIARNLPVTRFGVYVSPDGLAVVVFGRMEVLLDPLPRRLRPGEAIRLRGQVAARHDQARVYLHRPDGKIDETPIPGRKIDLALRLSGAGVYRLEVMSAGAGGPAVLANVPLYVGVDEPALASPAASGAANPVDAEARMLALLNVARRESRLPELAGDAELRAVARAHTQDMIAGGFFGHVSPTTGRVDSRLQRAGVRVALSGENVAQSDTAEAAHLSLMNSPAHRANMLDPKFTHVGIGVAARPTESRDLVATLVFVRRPRPPSSPVTPALVTEFITSLRRAKGLGPISVDPVLQRAAEAGVATLKADSATSPDPAIAAAHQALASETKRLHLGRRSVCVELAQVLELDELEQDPIILQRPPMKVGLATATKKLGSALKIQVLILAEGAACR
jgi:uncharacterized protein YkwD